MKEIEAPYGLTWKASEAAVEAQGVHFYDYQDEDDVEGTYCCYTKNPPKPVSYADHYILSFHPRRGLKHVTMWGKDITNDINGAKGKALYAEVKAMLIDKYGDPSNDKESITDEYNNFYECLDRSGPVPWRSLWNSNSGNGVLLSLGGLGVGVGYLMVSHSAANPHEAAKPNQQRPSNPPRTAKKFGTHAQTKAFIVAGKSVQEIAAQRGLTIGTIIDHIEKIYADYPNLDLSRYRPDEKTITAVRDAVAKCQQTATEDDLDRHGSLKLTPSDGNNFDFSTLS